ncbi:HigA family addiction module antitoxin [Stenotrophomonas maltophilia]|uniref:HigA family addiction module antitoxin n=1 Tax=Stenotrophomonas maltophilia TaxID=40324 RepID=UPI00216004DA|nr:HigA family addiction module antitoxin [Stenotrophomonas maltophilia]
MMHHHPHPGQTIKAMVFDPMGLSVTEAAERLAMSRVALSRVLNGKAGISPDLAIRLEMAGVSTAAFWLDGAAIQLRALAGAAARAAAGASTGCAREVIPLRTRAASAALVMCAVSGCAGGLSS